jgi:hypothetical protein
LAGTGGLLTELPHLGFHLGQVAACAFQPAVGFFVFALQSGDLPPELVDLLGE